MTVTRGTGDAGRGVEFVLVAEPVLVLELPVPRSMPVDVELVVLGDAGGWAVDGGVAADDLRLVVGRRLVCAIDADENRSSIARRRIVWDRVAEDFIRELSSFSYALAVAVTLSRYRAVSLGVAVCVAELRVG